MGLHAIQMQDGSLAIMQTVPQLIGYDEETHEPVWRDPSPQECMAKWPAEQRAAVVAHQSVDAVPADRTFRNAWKLDGKAIVHDMEKAREIKRDQLRSIRAPLLAALDVEYQRADEADDKDAKSDIVRRKQALRDITRHPAIDAASSIDDLKAVGI